MEFTIPNPRTPVTRVMLDQRDSVEQSGESEGPINIGQQLLMLSAQVMSLQAQSTENNKQSQQQPQQQQQRQPRVQETPAYSPVFGFEQRNQRRSDVDSNVAQPNYMRRRSMHLQDPAPQIATGYTQSIVPLNPDTCQVRLNTLNFSFVFVTVQTPWSLNNISNHIIPLDSTIVASY
jgi:hypothetical protein